MPARRRIAAALAVLAVGIAPGAAFAQSGGAGDDQYVDPIGGNSQQQQPSGGSNGNTSTGPSLSSTPTLSAQATPTATTSASPAASAQELPRTGADAGALAAIGAVLLLAGVALRRRLADARH